STTPRSPKMKSFRVPGGAIVHGRAAFAWPMKPAPSSFACFTTIRHTMTSLWILLPPTRTMRARAPSQRARARSSISDRLVGPIASGIEDALILTQHEPSNRLLANDWSLQDSTRPWLSAHLEDLKPKLPPESPGGERLRSQRCGRPDDLARSNNGMGSGRRSP